MPLGPGPAHAALFSGVHAAVAVDEAELTRADGPAEPHEQLPLPEPQPPAIRQVPASRPAERSGGGAAPLRQYRQMDPHELVPETELVRSLHARRWVLEWLTVVAGALMVALIVKVALFQAFVIPSGSMIPTLQIGDRVLVNKLTYGRNDMARGDIVVFHRPSAAVSQLDPNDDSDLIKRLIGLPGETLEGRADGIYVDGVKVDETWLVDGIALGPTFPPLTLADNEIFMMGDNRSGSSDSRDFGPVNIDLVVGEALIRVWPPSNLGSL